MRIMSDGCVGGAAGGLAGRRQSGSGMSFQRWGDRTLPLGVGGGGVETLVASPVGSATLALGRAMWTVLIPLSMFSMGPSRMATGAKRGQNSLGCLCFYSLSGQS